jgi:hypothetical protein
MSVSESRYLRAKSEIASCDILERQARIRVSICYARTTSENPSRDMLERRARIRIAICLSDEIES